MSPTREDPAKFGYAGKMCERFKEDFDAESIDVVDTTPYEFADEDWPDATVDVTFDVVDGKGFTRSAMEFGRDNGLYVFDSIVTVGPEAQNKYDTDAAVTIRFGVSDDAVNT